MKYRKTIILLIIAIFLFSIATVCASDVNETKIASESTIPIEMVQSDEISVTDDNLASEQLNDEEILSQENAGTFFELQNNITTKYNGTLELDRNYEYSDSFDTNGIEIEQSITIDGKGHTIDAKGKSRIFNITGNNVTINNLIFANGNLLRGGAIYSTGQITLNNVTFIKNNAYIGGAIYSTGQMKLNNADFINNNASAGGAIASYEDVFNCSNSRFINNTAITSGGAIYSDGKLTLNNTTFINNTAITSGGAILNYNGILDCYDSKFIDNYIDERGSAIYSHMAEANLFDCNFTDNSAYHGTIYSYASQINCVDCNFIENNAYSGSSIFIFYGEVNCSVCNFIDNVASYGLAIYSNSGAINCFDCNFTRNSGRSGSIYLYDGKTILSGCNFVDNVASSVASGLYADISELNIYNSYVTSNVSSKWGQMWIRDSTINIYNSSFVNMITSYCPALYLFSCNCSFSDSKFVNLTANMTAGAIAVKDGGNACIRNCEFINVTSSKNAGAILADIIGDRFYDGNIIILDTLFKDSSSDFGGALIQLGGNLEVNNTEFINNKATFNGGAVFLSHVNAQMNNCTFDSNYVEIFEDIYPTYGGAIYSDNGILTVFDSKFINNTATLGNAIYAYDTSYNISNTLFANNTNDIYTVFDKESNLNDNTYDNISTNNTYYATDIDGKGLELQFINNTINVTALPSRFDLRDWGWVSPVRDQGAMGACWAFGVTGALESALLKVYGLVTDFSENNMKNTMLQYSRYGVDIQCEAGYDIAPLAYLLSWLGAFSQDADSYDELGKISAFITTNKDIHVQDAIMVFHDSPGSSQIKSAIIKYGSLRISFCGQSKYDEVNPYFNPETSAQYINESLLPNHVVSLVGWDDKYSKENFLITPPGDGAWILKNSWGTDWGDEGYFYVSYYDKTFLTYYDDAEDSRYALGFVFDNNVNYNKNYQYDIGGLLYFSKSITRYYNVFESFGDDLIAGVGTYFNDTNVSYTVEIYVNDELKLVQIGSSPFRGYHTIKLDSYIPIKDGDIFKAVITSNALPYFLYSRQHFEENTSFGYEDGEWIDLSTYGTVACLKIYTVCDEERNDTLNYTFTDLNYAIETAGNILDLNHDYVFSNESDDGYVVISKDNFVINGNNFRLDGNKQSGIFNITGNNVTINNLIFVNGNSTKGGAIYSTGNITLNNVTFISNCAVDSAGTLKNPKSVTINCGGAIANYGGTINCNNTRFIDNYAESGSSVYLEDSHLNLYNTLITSSIPNMRGQIYAKRSSFNLENVDIVNISSTYACALYLEDCKNLTVINSRFVNLTGNITAGAIAVKHRGNVYIKGCEFVNIKSFKNAGAVNVDYIEECNVTILDTVFANSSSMMGGAYIQLEGNLFMNNTNFTNNRAVHNGGAAYLAFLSNAEINNCVFDSNIAEDFEDYPGSGGAIYSDYNNIVINNSKFINNSASEGGAIFAIDSCYFIVNSTFKNNTNALYTYYDVGNCCWDNNDYNNESIILNKTRIYQSCVDSPSLRYNLTNSNLNVTFLPERFDLRDWGWLTPVKAQGRMGACWTFGLIGAVESAILKTYGVELDLSEGNLHHNMLRYFDYGCTYLDEGGWGTIAASYLVGWYGPALEETDIYDEVGKISPYITTGSDVIHVQDVIYVLNDEVPNATKIKLAILNYGALEIPYLATHTDVEGYLNLNTSAQYTYGINSQNHEVTLIGWDDNYSKDNFIKTPPGDGAWIIKNSWGTSEGDDGFFYISYYDESFSVPPELYRRAVGIILENTVPYNKNYGHDYVWGTDFASLNDLIGVNGTVTYSNYYEAEDDDLIAGVGTYFYSSGENYTVEIYVNDQLILTQDGVSPFTGFHTIKLNEYVPIKKGDKFNAVITSDLVPVSLDIFCRVHFSENHSFIIYNDTKYDLYDFNAVACLKVYTVEDDSRITENTDISVDYGGESFFSVKVVTADGHSVAGASVWFTINGKTVNVTTDDEGVAKLEINEVPGTYIVTAVYNNQTYENNVTVTLDLQNCKVVAKDIAVDYAGGSYFTVKVVSYDGKVVVGGESVIFMFNGDAVTAKTDNNGVAKIKITQTPGKYTIKTLFNGKTYTNKVTVKQVLTASKVTVKKTAKKFSLKAKLKINGKLVKGKTVTFKFNGKTYKVKTNAKGIAQKTLKNNVIKKLKKGKTYTVKVTYLKDTVKSSVKVK
jgi:predicted outer membrane repeat protein